MRNKRGQFFILAAMIIIGVVVSLATAVNSIEVGNDNEAFYDLALREVGPETKRVLDYGVFNTVDTNSLIEDFLTEYANYIAKEEVLFVYGDRGGVNFTGLSFIAESVGQVGIFTGGIPETVTIQGTTEDTAVVLYDNINEKITVEINGIFYEFNLRDGQNFFFVIIKEENDEKFVATG